MKKFIILFEYFILVITLLKIFWDFFTLYELLLKDKGEFYIYVSYSYDIGIIIIHWIKLILSLTFLTFLVISSTQKYRNIVPTLAYTAVSFITVFFMWFQLYYESIITFANSDKMGRDIFPYVSIFFFQFCILKMNNKYLQQPKIKVILLLLIPMVLYIFWLSVRVSWDLIGD